ncbi:alanine--glyoxylate aminotransferase family protein [Lampropedia puyangensis]|uniref:Alanine--glyoxylate aminotransferase family protein n=1 Tax=Lampropedia puyangensis TaxID=1330072 RepID=A0A4S8EY59_9BURK|nr:aminotransferase class V-fold PLP-dependent enzyme [Lampropedia puyangensis]THT99889.1 alanine--glyoxylate aminotransferase family protein [Lampropedia puyangensis]
MPALLPNVDPDGLLEYSVVYTDRALNHMSARFVGVMQDIIRTLKKVYQAQAVAIVPGSGTFGMEAVARQFAHNEKVLIVRNGFFSFRWSQIFEVGQFGMHGGAVVHKAVQVGAGAQAPWAPASAEAVAQSIRDQKPKVVFAPHCETASGILLSDDYIRTIAQAAHDVGALMVLDCIASGTMWVDMQALGVDVLISAPQKGWSSTPCAALVMLSARAREAIETTQSSSYACDLKKWLQIAEGYEKGQHAYYATMPTDSLLRLRDTMVEMQAIGFDVLRERQMELGTKVRALLQSRGMPSVAAAGFESPGVVVSYTTDPEIQSAKKFLSVGIQAASGVPLMCDEGPDFRSFRLGLFGIDKWKNVDRTVLHLQQALDRLGVS